MVLAGVNVVLEVLAGVKVVPATGVKALAEAGVKVLAGV